MKRPVAVLGHLGALALVVAIATYWAIKIFTPPPMPAPPPVAAPPPREPDPVLAARMFGLVQLAQTPLTGNIQLAGVFAAGADSSAILIIDGKPARVFLLGQEVVPGMTLEAVRADGVTLAGVSGRQELRLPPRPAASVEHTAPPPAFTREGNTLTAPAAPAVAQPGPGAAAAFLPPAVPQGMPSAVASPARKLLRGASPEGAPDATGNPSAQ
ncbi:MAG: type II secretion system protein N [Sutterellaceae bacterium]|nr:hypothetical protein [Burkholderiaceae bacterium]MDW8429952.1 type II secretion system protein N [Sutterellaceae bacterium]